LKKRITLATVVTSSLLFSLGLHAEEVTTENITILTEKRTLVTEKITLDEMVINNKKAIIKLMQKVSHLENELKAQSTNDSKKRIQTSDISIKDSSNTTSTTAHFNPKTYHYELGEYRVRTFYANVRKFPSLQSKVSTCYKKGAKIFVTKIDGDWGMISNNLWINLYTLKPIHPIKNNKGVKIEKIH